MTNDELKEEDRWYRERRAEFKELPYRRAHLRERLWYAMFLAGGVLAVSAWIDNPELSIAEKIGCTLLGAALCAIAGVRGERAEHEQKLYEQQRQLLATAQMFEREVYVLSRAYEERALSEDEFEHLEYCLERTREERGLIKWRTE